MIPASRGGDGAAGLPRLKQSTKYDKSCCAPFPVAPALAGVPHQRINTATTATSPAPLPELRLPKMAAGMRWRASPRPRAHPLALVGR